MRINVPCGTISLEGEIDLRPGAERGAVICHPHPQYGGDMHNAVVRAIASACAAAGLSTLRFNFRGVGASGGAYGGGVAEQEDVRAALHFLMQQGHLDRVTLAGYSFGSMLALQVGFASPEVDEVVAVAPPIAFFDLDGVVPASKRTLFIAGDRDDYCGIDRLKREVERLPEPKTLHVVAGADHFFFGFESEVGRRVLAFLQRSARATPA